MKQCRECGKELKATRHLKKASIYCLKCGHRVAQKAYRARSKDKCNAANKAWRVKNKLLHKELTEKWRRENRERVRATSQKWQSLHSNYAREWIKKNRDKHNAYSKKSVKKQRETKALIAHLQLQTILQEKLHDLGCETADAGR